MNLNEKIVVLRKKMGVSQELLAEKLGVTRQTVSNWEQGLTTPDVMQAKKLSNIFKISLDDLTDNKLDFEFRDNSNNMLKDLVGKSCVLILDEDYMDNYLDNKTCVKVLDVGNSFIKVQFKKGKVMVEKLIDIDIVNSIKVEKEK